MCNSDLNWAIEWLTANGEAPRVPSGPFSDRPWALVFRIDCKDSRYFLKIPPAAFGIEAELQRLLVNKLGAPVVDVLACHPVSKAFLMRGAGEPLRVTFPGDGDLAPLVALMPGYAAAQIAASSVAGELLALGLPDWRPSRIPELFAEMLATSVQDESGFSAAELARLADTQEFLSHLCVQLDACGLPLTVDHGDFGDGNIFVLNGNSLIADWGETVIGHPFLSVVNLTETFRRRHGELGAESLASARQAYLASWTGNADREALDRAMGLAGLLYPVRYALGFHRVWEVCGLARRSGHHGWSGPALRKWMTTAEMSDRRWCGT